jgi:hypothetical protein
MILSNAAPVGCGNVIRLPVYFDGVECQVEMCDATQAAGRTRVDHVAENARVLRDHRLFVNHNGRSETGLKSVAGPILLARKSFIEHDGQIRSFRNRDRSGGTEETTENAWFRIRWIFVIARVRILRAAS